MIWLNPHSSGFCSILSLFGRLINRLTLYCEALLLGITTNLFFIINQVFLQFLIIGLLLLWWHVTELTFIIL